MSYHSRQPRGAPSGGQFAQKAAPDQQYAPLQRKDRESALMFQKVVFTGTLETMKRAQAKQALRKAGGFPQNSMTLHTNYLVVGRTNLAVVDDSGTSRKYQTARQYGVTIIDEDEFLEMLGEDSY